MAYAAVQKRFKLAVRERSIHHRYRREGTDSEEELLSGGRWVFEILRLAFERPSRNHS